MMNQYKPLPGSVWKNHCPIVLVHGFGGHTTEKNYLLKGYFHYAFESEVLGDNTEVYEVDQNPWGSVHDRACELY